MRYTLQPGGTVTAHNTWDGKDTFVFPDGSEVARVEIALPPGVAVSRDTFDRLLAAGDFRKSERPRLHEWPG